VMHVGHSRDRAGGFARDDPEFGLSGRERRLDPERPR